jgi:hypothetical protein
MSRNTEVSDFLLACLGGLGVAWGSVSSVVFWDACLNTSCKKKLMDDYDSAGAETMVFRQLITIQKRDFFETHRTQLVHYAYQVPGSEDRLILKHCVTKHRPGLEVPPLAGSFIVKVLPGFPLIGHP